MITYANYAAEYISDCYDTTGSGVYYLRLQKALVFPFIGNEFLPDITPSQMLHITNTNRAMGISEKCIRESGALTRTILNQAVLDGRIESNPSLMLPLWRSQFECIYPASIEEHALLIRSIDQLPLRNLFGFSYMTGLTIKDLLTVQFNTADPVKRTFRINTKRCKGMIFTPARARTYYDSEWKKHMTSESGDTHFFIRTERGPINSHDIIHNIHMLRSLTGNATISARHLWRGFHLMYELVEEDHSDHKIFNTP